VLSVFFDRLLLVFFLFLDLHHDRVFDKVRKLLDGRADLPVVEVVFRVLLQVERHVGAARRPLDRLDGERPLSVGFPKGGGVALPAGASDDRYLVRHHERGVEADAELADQVRLGRRRLTLHRLQKRFRARLGDRAEVVDHLLFGHADAVVADGESAGGLVGRDLDLPILVVLQDVFTRQAVELDAINRVARVAHQLAQEDLRVRVERVRNQVQQLLEFCFEFERIGHGRTPRGERMTCTLF